MCKKSKNKAIEDQVMELGYVLNNIYRDDKSKLYVNVTCVNNHTYDIRFDTLKIKKNCKYCTCNKFEYKDVKKYVEKFNQTLISETYENARTKLSVRCENGHIYNPTFDNFKNKETRCPHCKKLSKITYEEVKNYVEYYGYELLSNEYLNNKSHIQLKCPKGSVYKVTFDNFKNKNKRCSCCSGGTILKYDDIKLYISNVNHVLLDTEYINARTKLSIMCDEGHLYKTTFDNFKNKDTRCPYCKKPSKGEEIIASILAECNIEYVRQYRFDDCKFKYTLPFDFYIESANTLIEFDGKQHFEYVKVFGGFDGFIDTKIRDTVKNIYCQHNNIKLVRIPYWEIKNIKNILIRELNLK